jgi:hypothetical protein
MGGRFEVSDMSQKKIRYSARRTRIYVHQGDRWVLLPGGGFGLQRREPQDNNPRTRA